MHATRIVINGTFSNKLGKLGNDPEVYKNLVEEALSRHVPTFKGEVVVEDVVSLEKLRCDDCCSRNGEVVTKFFRDEDGYCYGVCWACVDAETGERFESMKRIGKRSFLLWLMKDREKKRVAELIGRLESRAKLAFKQILHLVSPNSLEVKFWDFMSKAK